MADTEVGVETPPNVLTLNIEIPGAKMLKNTKVPDDYKTEELIASLVKHAGLPFVDEADARPVHYTLISDRTGQMLREGETLRDSGVRSGDKIKLFSSRPVAAHKELPSLPFAPRPEEKEVNVHLTIIDSPKPDYTRLPLDTAVGLLIRQLIKDYKVLEKDRFGRSGSFRLSSGNAARLLSADETLRQAGVMHEDRLTLLKDEEPGARP